MINFYDSKTFSRLTGLDRSRNKIHCPECKKGVPFRVDQLRMRNSMGQQTYCCDKCKSISIVQFDYD